VSGVAVVSAGAWVQGAPAPPQNVAPRSSTRTPSSNVAPAVVTPVPTINSGSFFGAQAPVAGTTYTVESGDSWWGIANKFGITLDALLIANNTNYTTTPLFAGDTLTIPSSSFSPAFIPFQGNGGGPTLCRDGTYSHSSGRGTCSWHGG
jgi:LysM repeat protein